MISLKELLAGESFASSVASEFDDILIRGLECDSRKVGKDFLFFAFQGTKIDGTAFVNEAIRKGAAGIVSDKPIELPSALPFFIVPDCRLAMANIAARFYGDPSARMHVVGITGTNGKTTSSYIIEHLLRKQNKKTGVLGTINYRYADKIVPAVETTPGSLRIHQILSQMAEAKSEYAVMEVSSHALDQRRVSGVAFKAALFTNLTQDHLDYHGTLENYFYCKSKLFKGLSPDSFSILNWDDPWARKLQNETSSKVFTYGIDNAADLRASGIRWETDSTIFDLLMDRKKILVQSPLIGRHNVYNVLGSLAVLRALGFDIERCAKDLADFAGIPGRLEAVRGGQDFSVFVDFAHTPDGLENVLKTLLPYRKNKLIVVFGCGGDRDKTKRPKMGNIAAAFADYLFITSDNPRSEDPKAIAEEVRQGIPADFKNFSVTLDRKRAIRQALLSAKKDDIVLLAGKGHETTQVIGKETFAFNDKEEAEKVLNGY